jgi:hypothetical protein
LNFVAKVSIKEDKMAKKNVLKLVILTIVVALVLSSVSCVSYKPIDVTNTMAAQITSLKLHNVAVGEEVKTLYVDRTGSLVKDLNELEGGSWYRLHQDKIVSVEAVVKYTSYVYITMNKEQWRVEYVD